MWNEHGKSFLHQWYEIVFILKYLFTEYGFV